MPRRIDCVSEGALRLLERSERPSAHLGEGDEGMGGGWDAKELADREVAPLCAGLM